MAKQKSLSDFVDVAFLHGINQKLDKVIASQLIQGQQLDDILRILRREQQFVTPELETAVKAVAKIARFIDEKVPDQNVPPNKT